MIYFNDHLGCSWNDLMLVIFSVSFYSLNIWSHDHAIHMVMGGWMLTKVKVVKVRFDLIFLDHMVMLTYYGLRVDDMPKHIFKI